MKFSILGAGSWGTAFAKLLVENGHDVLLWARRKEVARKINDDHKSEYLEGIELPVELRATTDLQELSRFSDLVVIAVPVKHVRKVLKRLWPAPRMVLNLSKGIDESLKTVSQIVQEIWPDTTYAVLSGPCHAIEVARKLPTAVVVASRNLEVAKTLQKAVSNSYFRVYLSHDVLGVEVSGAVKNVIAIAAGVVDGLGGWHNAKASLITRGLHEMARFGLAFGAENPLTFMGLAGVGDLIVTCNSPYSRNRYVGEMVAKGAELSQVLEHMKMVAEGVHTVGPLLRLARDLDVEMPICEQVYEILFKKKNPASSIKELMERPLKLESCLTAFDLPSSL
ncbi:glycerol-3-phosphate dehydrogenase [Pseudothermotoga hypogea DSM 11164 = NBRC 106472]|uniref:Glycerol-3-phosphate dehydrogenase [NAD(P)+] n=1 Tax=Pseudothermotoga hypogea DSM 11164 = NBRC 106472 TaxID=1123384 RepID=A0A0X1KQP6_9THEM|nr:MULTISPECIES: NAD(P)H-dependent glycerol-3-phosphate dehydrogenase [Pseudothermotoga]AJC73520.1 glycerol-3-phosphate dehydrogenase [Pseudothermotoga hypogea DSM 11164 = NBRC 106472]MBC7123298.1 NAD(P)-dependent glycerol-3-phosphate dehydrogenase [Pseudothermotoga sp.]MDI6862297.1 NAD(P)H-dependent glycerol-3-phosphate dehydrogenase [Pseudothermotoga sp.]